MVWFCSTVMREAGRDGETCADCLDTGSTAVVHIGGDPAENR